MQHHSQNNEHRNPRNGDSLHGFALLDKHHAQTDEKQHITHVGKRDAPRVAGHFKNGVALVVVVALIETIMLVFQDMVHRNDDILLEVAIAEPQITHIVFGPWRVGIGLNLEAV